MHFFSSLFLIVTLKSKSVIIENLKKKNNTLEQLFSEAAAGGQRAAHHAPPQVWLRRAGPRGGDVRVRGRDASAARGGGDARRCAGREGRDGSHVPAGRGIPRVLGIGCIEGALSVQILHAAEAGCCSPLWLAHEWQALEEHCAPPGGAATSAVVLTCQSCGNEVETILTVSPVPRHAEILSLVVELADSSPACDAAECGHLRQRSCLPTALVLQPTRVRTEPKDPCLSGHLKALRARREAKRVDKRRVRTARLSEYKGEAGGKGSGGAGSLPSFPSLPPPPLLRIFLLSSPSLHPYSSPPLSLLPHF